MQLLTVVNIPYEFENEDGSIQYLTLKELLYYTKCKLNRLCNEIICLHELNLSYWSVKSRYIGATNTGLKYEIYKECKKLKKPFK